MLIDAIYAEETRVVVMNEKQQVDEFDFESSHKKQLKGNIYLATVTRVEPSLQACFVDFGGNRHGFLPFSEIHPDYFRIPVEDRQALLEAHRQAGGGGDSGDDDDRTADVSENLATNAEDSDDAGETDLDGDDDSGEDSGEEAEAGADSDGEAPTGQRRRRRSGKSGQKPAAKNDSDPERKLRKLLSRYRIQEVIKSRQVMLVQVVKEERGNKGAALTTYMSLAGRYCVFMPNTTKGSGISRKISDGKDRQKLRDIINDLEIEDGTAVIVRTAGEKRSKIEIKRDYAYLSKVWENIREDTLQSSAPKLIYEEGSLIKRAVRDIYSREIDEILIEGTDGFKLAREMMLLLMPGHARRVKLYQDPIIPLFHKYDVERQLEDIHKPSVKLKSGGYVVISPTEALVSIDVNSGRAIRERNIEETAYRTNLEAADEIARQLRLRDLAGLVVIDFIDMNERRYCISVEKRLRDALKGDRSRVQVGRLSSFGLLELSRQRLRASLLEIAADTCHHCAGTGHVRSLESSALQMLRVVEQEGITQNISKLIMHLPTAVALYLLNHKRDALSHLESRFGMAVEFAADDSLVAPEHNLERITGTPGEFRAKILPSSLDFVVDEEFDSLPPEEELEDEDDAGAFDRVDQENAQQSPDAANRDDRDDSERRRRRRGGRNRNRRKSFEDGTQAGEDPILQDGDFPLVPELLDLPPAPPVVDDSIPTKVGGRTRSRRRAGTTIAEVASAEPAVSDVAQPEPVEPEPVAIEEAPAADAKKARGRPRKVAARIEPELVNPELISSEPLEQEAVTKPITANDDIQPLAQPKVAEPLAAEPAEKIEELLITTGEKRDRRGWWRKP
jgi:ribonuclease E